MLMLMLTLIATIEYNIAEYKLETQFSILLCFYLRFAYNCTCLWRDSPPPIPTTVRPHSHDSPSLGNIIERWQLFY